MARRCSITGKQGQYGNRVSHANNKRKHLFAANIQTKRVYVPELKKHVKLKVTAGTLRTIDKIGLIAALKKHNLSLKDVQVL